MQTDNRPLSPHLQIYKLGWTGNPSILHRITGVAATVGSLLLIYWLVSLAAGPEAFARVNAIYTSWIGQAILIALSWVVIYKSLAGIRHIVWDFGFGFNVVKAQQVAKLIVFGSFILTALLWAAIYAL